MTAQDEAKRTMMSTPLKIHPLTLVRQAVEWARNGELPVSLNVTGWGVCCLDGEWYAIGPVSPLGALLLANQPGDASLITAAAEVLNTPRAYVEGFLCGSEHTEPDGHAVWMPTAKFYLLGIEHGARYRLEFVHGRRVK